MAEPYARSVNFPPTKPHRMEAKASESLQD